MENIEFENAKKGLCIICGEYIDTPAIWICDKCSKPCEVDHSRILEETKDKMLVDVKSKCCGADVQSVGRMTCSEECHEKFVDRLEKEFGDVKKVIDQTIGIAYKVPTRDIVENGLTWQDLPKYPQWDD